MIIKKGLLRQRKEKGKHSIIYKLMVIIKRQQKTKKIIAVFIAAFVLISYAIGFGLLSTEKSSAAANGLDIKVGFYGGPYYDLKSYSYGQLQSMASGTVHTYTGVDSGKFMRVCYAWGIPMSALISDAGINTSSVQYLHMGTSDNYGESYTTFTASSLMNSGNFYPNMTRCVDPEGSTSAQTIGTVPSGATSGAQSVPTIMALGYTDWSRAEIIEAANIHEEDVTEEYQVEEIVPVEKEVTDPETGETKTIIVNETQLVTKTRTVKKKVLGENKYKKYSAGSLGASKGVRLVFGQSSITNNNVGLSDHSVYEMVVQLAGAPNIKVNKTLISGKKDEIGSKYEITVKSSLPDSYSYIPNEVLINLQNQVLKKIKLGTYDKSVVKITKIENGKYQAEIIGKGETDVKVSYSRGEYGGGMTSSSETAHLSGNGDTGNGSNGDGAGGTNGDGNGKADKGKADKGEADKAGDGKDKKEDEKKNVGIKKDKKEDTETVDDTEIDQSKWMEADEIMQAAADTNQLEVTNEKNKMLGVGAGAAGLLGIGFGGTIYLYRRRL